MQNDFNLVQAGAVLKRKTATIIACTILAGIVAAITVFVVPQYYRGTVSIVSANPTLADKARLFNTNIQSLYSYFGSGDDLDRLQGIADMDTTYKKLVDTFSLVSYFNAKGDSPAEKRTVAVKKLRKKVHFERTEEGQLHITVWTKHRRLSADIANRMVAMITEAGEAIWQANYRQSLSGLEQTIASMERQYEQAGDSLGSLTGPRRELAVARMQTLLEQIKQYRKTADEFSLAAQSAPPVLYVLEPAVAATKAERPDKPAIIIAACVAGFVFSILALLINNRKPVAA